MWHYLHAVQLNDGTFVWHWSETNPPSSYDDDDAFVLAIENVPMPISPTGQFRPKALAELKTILERNGVTCIVPSDLYWTMDLDKLAERCNGGQPFDWFTGHVVQLPRFVEYGEAHPFYGSRIQFTFTKENVHEPTMTTATITVAPTRIADSLDRFRSDYPDSKKAAFVMMRFGDTSAHTAIVKAIRDVLKRFGIAGLRADDREYHEDLLPNVETYMHGCGFGIAVFERIEAEQFNPNVGLEVGYMRALCKPVCLLKDKTLKQLQSDLIGKLYKEFDILHPNETVPDQVESWLSDHELIGRPNQEQGASVPRTKNGSGQLNTERATSDSDSGNFLEYLGGLSGDELYWLAKGIADGSQTLECYVNDTTPKILASKGFLTPVPVRQSLEGMQRHLPTPHTIPTSVWRYLNEHKAWLFERAIEKNQDRNDRLPNLNRWSER